MECIITAADINISLDLKDPETKRYFSDFLLREKGEKESIAVPAAEEERIRSESRRLQCAPSFAEYSLLLESVANPVLRHNRFFFHGAAFLWRGEAYIFAAKSGTGKTTQLKHWLSMYPDEIEVINGDKPIIEHKNGTFHVYPSPWTGKENYRGNHFGKLAGIILLEQGDHDEFLVLDAKEAVFPIYLQFLFKPEDKESIDLVSGYEEELLSAVPVYKLINRGTAESAVLTHNAILRKESHED